MSHGVGIGVFGFDADRNGAGGVSVAGLRVGTDGTIRPSFPIGFGGAYVDLFQVYEHRQEQLISARRILERATWRYQQAKQAHASVKRELCSCSTEQQDAVAQMKAARTKMKELGEEIRRLEQEIARLKTLKETLEAQIKQLGLDIKTKSRLEHELGAQCDEVEMKLSLCEVKNQCKQMISHNGGNDGLSVSMSNLRNKLSVLEQEKRKATEMEGSLKAQMMQVKKQQLQCATQRERKQSELDKFKDLTQVQQIRLRGLEETKIEKDKKVVGLEKEATELEREHSRAQRDVEKAETLVADARRSLDQNR